MTERERETERENKGTEREREKHRLRHIKDRTKRGIDDTKRTKSYY